MPATRLWSVEARDVLGGKVAAWQDEDGDWYETGSAHLLRRLPQHAPAVARSWTSKTGCSGRAHSMIFNQKETPGTYSRFDFPDLPAPLNGVAADPRQQRHAHLA
jgi:15-cis-phytoene desaturase